MKSKYFYFLFFFSLLLAVTFVSACANPGSCSVNGHSTCGDYYNLSGTNHTGELCTTLTDCDAGGWPVCNVSCSACPGGYTCTELSLILASCVSGGGGYGTNMSGFSQAHYNLTLLKGDSYTYDLNTPLIVNYARVDYWMDLFSGGSQAGLCWLNPSLGDINITSGISCSQPFTVDGVRIYVYSTRDDIYMTIKNVAMSDPKQLNFCGFSGFSSNMTTCTDFMIYPQAVSTASSCTLANPGFTQTMACSLEHAFPDSKTLSTAGKFAIVIIFLLIVTVLFYVLVYFVTKPKIPDVMNWVIFIIDVLITCFFVAIGYIPIAFVIIVAIIALALTFFRIKSGFTAGK